jgi:hypothetical protein
MAKTQVFLQQMDAFEEEKLFFFTMLAGRQLAHPYNKRIALGIDPSHEKRTSLPKSGK